MRWLVIGALLGAAPVAHAQPAASPHVAVVIDLAANVSPARAAELGGAMADALERQLAVDATGGADVARRLPPSGVPDECVAQPACIADLARRLDATEVLFLSLTQIGTTVQVDATWARAATGETRARPRVEVPADARAGEVFAAAAARLLPDARRRAPTAVVVAGPTEPRRHLSTTAWIVGGTSAVIAAGAVGLGLSVRASYQSCDRDGDACSDGRRDGIRTRAIAADALGAAAVVGLGVTTYLYLRSARRDHAPPVQATIAPLPAGAIADVRVEF